MRLLFRVGTLALAAYGAKSLYDQFFANQSNQSSNPSALGNSPINLSATNRMGAQGGHDTPTGTDPNAKYSEPGFHDKSLGQAVNQDQQLVDELLDETRGDVNAAESQFRSQSAGSPALARQENERGSGAGT